MEVKIMIHCVDISKEELLLLLQTIRVCEQQHFKQKTLGIWMETEPPMSVQEANEVFSQITPPFAQMVSVDAKGVREKSLQIHCGPRLLMVGGKAVGTCEDVVFDVVDVQGAADTELAEVADAVVVSLVKRTKA